MCLFGLIIEIDEILILFRGNNCRSQIRKIHFMKEKIIIV